MEDQALAQGQCNGCQGDVVLGRPQATCGQNNLNLRGSEPVDGLCNFIWMVVYGDESDGREAVRDQPLGEPLAMGIQGSANQQLPPDGQDSNPHGFIIMK